MKRIIAIGALLLTSCGGSAIKFSDTTKTVPSTTVDLSWEVTEQADVKQISTVLHLISDDASNQDPISTRSDCGIGTIKMKVWEKDAKHISIPAVKGPFVAALTDFSTAFTACSVGDLQTATTALQNGAEHMRAATAAVSQIGAG